MTIAMAEKYSPEKGMEGTKDMYALILVAALAVFAFIGTFLTAPFRK